MKSRTRKAKSRVLIAFAEGIASSFAIELAMLFCHAGSEVKTAFIANAAEWVCQKPLKDICGHAALTMENRPAWVNNHRFDLTVVINPSASVQQQLCSEQSSDPVIEFILKKGGLLSILQTASLLPQKCDFNAERIFFQELPENPFQLHRAFFNAFSAATILLAGRNKPYRKTFFIQHAGKKASESSEIEAPEWISGIKKALLQSGFTMAEPVNAELLITNSDCHEDDISPTPSGHKLTNQHHQSLLIDFVPPDCNHTFQDLPAGHLKVQRTEKGLLVYDLNGVRLIPDLKNHCAFSRLASMIDILLQKNNPQISSRSR